MSISLKLVSTSLSRPLVVSSMFIKHNSLLFIILNNNKSFSVINRPNFRYYHQIQNYNNHNNQQFNYWSTNVLKDRVIFSSQPQNQNNSQNVSLKASEKQLTHLCDQLSKTLPKFFSQPHNFTIYNRNIIFEDNIRNIKAVGLNAYAWQIIRIKVGAHLKYAKVTFNILKITQHVEDSTIKIRWRIIVYPGNTIVFAFWRFKLWKPKESIEKYKDLWIDGFSILHVGGDGLIYKHICDKVIPDSNEVKSDKKDSPLAIKLGMA